MMNFVVFLLADFQQQYLKLHSLKTFLKETPPTQRNRELYTEIWGANYSNDGISRIPSPEQSSHLNE